LKERDTCEREKSVSLTGSVRMIDLSEGEVTYRGTEASRESSERQEAEARRKREPQQQETVNHADPELETLVSMPKLVLIISYVSRDGC